MTLIFLQKAIVEETKKIFQGQKFIKYRELIDEEPERVPIQVYAQNIPKSLVNEPDLYVPFIVVRVEKSYKESINSGTMVDISFSIKIFDDEDANRGHEDLLNIIDRLEHELYQKRILANQYVIQYPFYSMLSEDDVHPFFIGAVFTRWLLPNTVPENDFHS